MFVARGPGRCERGGQLALTNTGNPALSGTLSLTTDSSGNAQLSVVDWATKTLVSDRYIVLPSRLKL